MDDVFESYLDKELEYHQRRYLEAEARGGRLATVSGTILAATGTLVATAYTEFGLNRHPGDFVVISLAIQVFLQTSSIICSVVSIIPQDRRGQATRVVLINKRLEEMATYLSRVDCAQSRDEAKKSIISALPGLTWTSRYHNESERDFVFRSKCVELLAFKRAIFFRQMWATRAIHVLTCSIPFLVIAMCGVFFDLYRAAPS